MAGNADTKPALGHMVPTRDSAASQGLEALIRAASAGGGPAGSRPVEKWNPPDCGDIGMRIARDGTWFYQGSPIGRIGLVKLFASILRKDEDGKTYLVTPVEKVPVTVDDAPLTAVEMAVSGTGPGQSITFRTNLDDVVTVGADHPLRFEIEQPSGGLKPYVRVRGRLDALVTRALYADLVELAVARDGESDNGATAGLWSGGIWWPLDQGRSD